MKIRRFLVTVTCPDRADIQPEHVENAIYHGLLENGGPIDVRSIDEERHIDYPDLDYTLAGHDFDVAMEAWDKRAEEELSKVCP